MPSIKFLLKVSRPRFWLYLFGPYLIGLVAAANDKGELLSWRYLVFAVYFTLPANLLVYGINDIFDYETDRLNAKKLDYEALVTPEKRGWLLVAIFALNLPFVAGLIYAPLVASNCIVAFLLLSIFYSAPPVRAKTKPFLDSAFNVLYVMPGVFAFALASGNLPSWQVIAAGGLWTAAMHAYSAIPDIEADKNAGISTIATVLGSTGTHIFCLAAYVGSAMLAWPYFLFLTPAMPMIAVIYVSLMLVSLMSKTSIGVFRIYKLFPVINALVGFALFWCVVAEKLQNY